MKQGWKTIPLSDLCEFQRGLTYTKSDEVDVSENIVLRATNINLATNLLDFSELKYINENVIVPASKKVKKDSLIICTASGSKSHLGKIAYIDGDYGYAFGGFMGMLTPKKDLLPKYLFYLMTSDAYRSFIGKLSDGANINNLRFDDLGQFMVPYPSLPEQNRIVAVLDEAFAALAKAKENDERNLANARELFESYLQDVFVNPKSNWVEKDLGEICTKIGSGATPHGGKKSYQTAGTSLIRSMNVYDREFFEKNLAFLNDYQAEELANVTLQDNDVLLNITGASVARCCVVSKQFLPGRVNQHVSIVRPQNDVALPQFLVYLLTSKPYKDRLLRTGEKGGSTRQAITKAQIERFAITLPVVEEQKRIVAKLDSFSKTTRDLGIMYQQKIANLEELKKSILQKAFSGELVGANT